jgi:Glutathione S-transferase, C-terminal domain
MTYEPHYWPTSRAGANSFGSRWKRRAHPTSCYEDQKPEALRRANEFCSTRLPKYLQWFESIVLRNPAGENARGRAAA